MIQPSSQTESGAEAGYAWLFEAKGVQRYLFDSGKLRDLIGASDMLAQLAASDGKDLIGDVLSAAGHDKKVRFSRRAGGAFCLHASEKKTLDEIRALWRLVISLRCPGLEYSDCDPASGASDLCALDSAYQSMGAVRYNSAAELPPAGNPFTAFNPRTGRVVTRIYQHNRGGGNVLADVVSQAQHEHSRTPNISDSVAGRFLGKDAKDGVGNLCVFPRNLERDEDDDDGNPRFPFRGQDQRLAFIHADLSGLGQIFMAASKPGSGRNAEDVCRIATEIENILEGAAKAATLEVLLPNATKRRYGDETDGCTLAVLPARPVLLGGDDITIIVRADLAVQFTAKLLQEIEKQSKASFAELNKDPKFSDLDLSSLSACAGIAIQRSRQPFLMANALAESLCKLAKTHAKFDDPETAKKPKSPPYPSYLAFHNAQSTLLESYEDILKRELTAIAAIKPSAAGVQPEVLAKSGILLTANPYLVACNGGNILDNLLGLAFALRNAPRGHGKLMEMAQVLFSNPKQAQTIFARWVKVLQQDDPAAFKSICEALNKVGFRAIGASMKAGEGTDMVALSKDELPENPNDMMDPQRQLFSRFLGPITDALELVDLGTRPESEWGSQRDT